MNKTNNYNYCRAPLFTKRGQVQMGESVAILFVFFTLLVFGFIFYVRIIGSSAESEVEEQIQLKAVAVAQKASFLPELQCSQENVRVENCIDIYKLTHFDDLILKNKLYYYDVFGFSKISVQRKFPDPKVFPVYNSEPGLFKEKLSTFIPISLYNATDDNYGFGILVVEVFTT